MMKHYCTPVPARRISTNGRLELRIVSKEAVRVQILAVKDSGIVQDCGTYDILSNSTLNKVYPSLHGLVGQFVLHIHFQNAQGETLEVMQQPYEIVASSVHSTRLLDGCWISILHWSDDEARLFNNGLRKMTDDDWKQHIYSMHKLGITSVLIQNVFDSTKYVHQHDMTADTYEGKAFYPSKLYPERMPLNCSNPIEAILTAADECGMAVFPGVGLYAWFDFTPESLEWHKRVTVELNELYGHHPSFYGWYISEEIMGSLYFDYSPVPNEKYTDIQDFFREYKAFVHELTPSKPIALAPNNIRMHWHEDEWAPIMENLDILIPFAFARSENNIKEIAAMCAKRGAHFWVDMEIFDFPFDDGLKPKSFPNLIKEIEVYDSLEQIYGYQYTGLLNEPGFRMELGGEDTEVLYVQYEEYLKDIRSKA